MFLCERVSFAFAPRLHPVCAQFCALLCCVFSGGSLEVDQAKLQQIHQKIAEEDQLATAGGR